MDITGKVCTACGHQGGRLARLALLDGLPERPRSLARGAGLDAPDLWVCAGDFRDLDGARECLGRVARR